MGEGVGTGADVGGWARFRRTPWRLQVYLVPTLVAAVVLPLVVTGGPGERRAAWLTAAVLVGISVLNVEIARRLFGGIAHTQQPHKALSAWAFCCAVLLPAPWLLVVVPFTYAHARWRGIRVPLWKWVCSAGYLVLAGLAAGTVARLVVGTQTNWMLGAGARGLLGLLLAALTFLAVETLLLTGSALLNDADDEEWLRRTLTDPSFYLTELGVLLVACLFAGVWTGGPWFVLLLVPLYFMVQRAALLQPMRERADAASRLAEQNEQLELANQFKVDLVGMLGHEVGNPLTSIVGYGQVGREALADGDVALALRCFEVVERNAAQIERVCADILALAKSDRGALTARPQSCLLHPQLVAAAAGQPPGRQPAVECPDDLSARVQPDHLDQVMANLLSNAEKYGGGAVRLVAEPMGEDRVAVSVVDRGPGVPPKFRERLFERFSRDATAAQRAAGTGLGLYITRELARANDGEVTHRDASPTGSVFTLTVPRGTSGDVDVWSTDGVTGHAPE
jgi:signal transduction histidine kinase